MGYGVEFGGLGLFLGGVSSLWAMGLSLGGWDYFWVVCLLCGLWG